MAEKLLICKHNDGLGHCDVFGGEYCVESPCQYEELVEYAPVVRCKYCKHYHDFETHFDCSHGYGIDYPREDDFCSYGEGRSE